jgi:centrosomal protein CEP41
LRFKNQKDKIIVVYMADERLGTHYSKLLFEKGFDNVYLLSGGVEKFLANYPNLVEGTKVPEIKKTDKKKSSMSSKSTINNKENMIKKMSTTTTSMKSGVS